MGRQLARIVLGAALLAVLVPIVHDAQARGPHRGGYYGRSYWHFSYHDRLRWHRGHWWHGRRYGRRAWWWVVDGYWYSYPAPYYPYPVYVPAAPVVRPALPPAHTATPPAQHWYYCDSPKGYYPYVRSCRRSWRPVPVKPPAGR